MDDSSFDELARSLSRPSRRGILSILGLALIPGLAATDGDDVALATRKKGKHATRRARKRDEGLDRGAVHATGRGGGLTSETAR
jgi:hypothetical protein